jgi:antirestriction protein ArdC
MNEPLNIRLSSREQYEAGDADGGVWLKLPAAAEQLNEALAGIGVRGGRQGTDYFITGRTTPVFGLAFPAHIDELNYMAARLAALDEHEAAKLNALNHTVYAMDRTAQFIDYADNHDFFVFLPGVTNAAELGGYYLHHSEMIEMPEAWKGAVDPLKLGQLAAESEAGQFTEYGYIVKSGDDWRSTYNGREDIPQEYRIAPEGRQQGREYDAIPARSPATTPGTPAAPIVLTADNPKDKLKEITDKLEQGVRGVFEGDQYRAYLETLSKFHNYSFNNCLLIAMQKPDATHVAGYGSWRDNFGRNVRKGEKGIRIIAPSPYKLKKEMERIDPKTGSVAVGGDGKPLTEQVEVTIPAFRVVTVFDISQTEGEPLPEIGVNELAGSVDSYGDFFKALEKSSPVPIAIEDIGSGAKGYYEQVEKRIVIQEGMSELQTLKTAIHEIAHARLHDIDRDAPPETPRPDRDTREVEAESVAFAVCSYYGLDTSDYSFGYIAGWSGDKELDTLKASLDTIRTEADSIITEVDGHFMELQQTAEQAAERQPGFEKWSEPAMPENAPDNPGAPSDNVKAYLPQQGHERRDGNLVPARVQQMHEYGYRWDGMNPIDRNTAFANFDKGQEVYLLYPDGTEAAATSRHEISGFEGMFGEKNNPLKTAEMSTEQNLNMIDGVFNNTPTVAELEAKARGGGQVSVSELASALKEGRTAGATPERRVPDAERPSNRDRLRRGRELLAGERKEPQKEKAVSTPHRDRGERS